MLKVNGYSKSIGIVLALGCASLLSAQLTSGQQSISITAHAAESISISVNSRSSVSFTLPQSAGMVALGSVTPSWTTSWVLASSRTAVKVYAYFIGATALTGLNVANTIAATSFSGAANGGSVTAFSSGAITAVNTGGAGMLVSSTTITGANLTSTKTDSLALYYGIGSIIPSTDTYSGTLLIQAQATP